MVIVAIISFFLPPWVDHTMGAYPGFSPPTLVTQNIVHVAFWIGLLIVGGAVGVVVSRLLKSKSAQWAWILPVIWLTVMIIASILRSQPAETGELHIIWQSFTGQDPDQGFFAVISTWPALTSIGYSLGA